MAYTEVALASRVQKWDADFLAEYVRDTRFRPYMGRANSNGSLMPILVNYELASGGKTVNVPFIAKSRGGGVQGNTRLSGNEEAMVNHNMAITVNWNRNAHIVQKPEEHWTVMDLRNAAKMNLRSWASEGLRDDIICAMWAFATTSWLKGKSSDLWASAAATPLEAYTAISEATKDAYLAANTDRFLFGAAVANHSANDHSAALSNVDTTSDLLSSGMISLAKLRAKETTTSSGNHAIRPFKTDDAEGREYFVLFVGARGMRDAKRDASIIAANRDARPREVGSNPIFQDGDLIWDGVIIREVPEIPVVTGVGASSSDVAPAFLCGAQAVGVAWGQEPASRLKKEDDYEFERGIGVDECRAAAKMIYNGVQHGMVNIYHSAPAAV